MVKVNILMLTHYLIKSYMDFKVGLIVKKLVYTMNFCPDEYGDLSKNHSIFILGGQRPVNTRP